MMIGESKTALHCIEGRELEAITFVRDYLQLHFEGPRLNAYVWPVVVVGRARCPVGGGGYRDELCARIGCVVNSAQEVPGEYIRLSFSDGSAIEVSLRDEDRSGPEALLLDDGVGKVWNVW